jgi:hypothetical protein
MPAAALSVLVVTVSLLGLSDPVLAQDQEIPGLQVQASSVQSLGSGYVQVEGVMSGNVIRDDSSEAQYRVPVTLVLARNATPRPPGQPRPR